MGHRHPLTLGAAGGSFASLAYRWLVDQVDSGIHTSLATGSDCICPHSFILEAAGDWDIKSLIAGIFIGLAIWPLLELAVLFRRLWSLAIRRQLAIIGRASGPLFREL